MGFYTRLGGGVAKTENLWISFMHAMNKKTQSANLELSFGVGGALACYNRKLTITFITKKYALQRSVSERS